MEPQIIEKPIENNKTIKKLNSFSTETLPCYDYKDENGDEVIEIPCNIEFKKDENGLYCLDY